MLQFTSSETVNWFNLTNIFLLACICIFQNDSIHLLGSDDDFDMHDDDDFSETLRLLDEKDQVCFTSNRFAFRFVSDLFCSKGKGHFDNCSDCFGKWFLLYYNCSPT